MEGTGSERHPTDDQLELYVLGRLTEDETKTLEAHLSGCSECATRLQEASEFFRDFAEAKPEEPEGGERRRQHRFFSESPATIQSLSPLDLHTSEVNVVDLSENGVKLASAERIGVGSIVRIRLGTAFILGEVRFCIPVGANFHVGVRIHDVS